ncbi:MAG: glycosyltransferase family 39 protein [Proteobacteria bacterium]|nr:glycosyltransferase family 39 protein [Pseudomonadota bacterium]
MDHGREIKEFRRLRIPLWLVWAVALLCVLALLGSSAILDNNEGLYAEIPREMLAAHDWRAWIIPHLNGLPYMEKPPLLYWLTALSFAVFGVSEWSARLVPALSSLACVALLLWFGRTLARPQAGRLAAIVFVSGIGVTAMSRVLMFDMLLTALLTAALMHAYLYFLHQRAAHLRWSYACLALALLAKGLVALILFGLVLVSWRILVSRSPAAIWRDVIQCLEPWALLVFLVIAVPWHVAASMVEPIFAWFYFINEHVLRFLGQREPHDYYSGPWWYYLPRMLLYLFPWSLLLLGMLARKRQTLEPELPHLRSFLWLAWLMPLLFFSISSAKANYYLVAVMPFAALHLALAVEDRNGLTIAGRVLPGLLVALLALAAIGAAAKMAVHEGLRILGMAQTPFVIGMLVGIAVLGLLSAVVAWRLPRIGVLAYLTLPLWITGALLAVLLALEPWISTKQTATYLQTKLPEREVYLYREFEKQSSLPFYLKQPVGVIDSVSNDLYWGNKLRRNEIMVSAATIAKRAETKPLAVVVLDATRKDFEADPHFARFKSEKRIGDSWIFINQTSR